uniref:putative uncharacterized protein DDB_G0271606 isoform X2 n=1 Tax=Erigeron canadensis TaxID=72917 RepID=UPI001CB954A1|nr:putative uncharacterized protein DDB_G0271606 isoform X2 [Erigeron canadensis]
MAVQAQCSSNIFLLNRNIQDQIGNNKYSLPSQPGSDHDGLATNLLDHQSFNHSLFNNNNNNNNNFQVGNCNTSQRNKGRQDTMNQFMSNIQQHSHGNQQFMDVSQYQSRNDIDVSTGLQLAFNDHHQHQQQHSYDHLLSQDLSTLINQQANEIHHYLQTQGEEFRRKLAEKRQRHYHALIGAANESATRMMKEKEMEAEKAARRHAELSARASQLSAEAEVWQARARAQEAVAAALQVQLQQAMVGNGGACVSTGVEVAEREAEDAESSYIDPERVVVDAAMAQKNLCIGSEFGTIVCAYGEISR